MTNIDKVRNVYPGAIAHGTKAFGWMILAHDPARCGPKCPGHLNLACGWPYVETPTRMTTEEEAWQYAAELLDLPKGSVEAHC